MSNEITTPNRTGVAALGALRQGLKTIKAQMPQTGSGKPILRMLQEKDGWVFGQEDNVLPLGTAVVFNTLTLRHGYSCWTDRKKGEGKNQMLDEQLLPMTTPKPMPHELPLMTDPNTGRNCEWKALYTIEGKILDGKYAGTEFIYKPTSAGGVKAVDALTDAINVRIPDDPDEPMTPFLLPICELAQSDYSHTSYGKTYNPELPVVGWMDLEGNEEGDETTGTPPARVEQKAPEPPPEVEEPAASEEPVRRRRRA